MVLGFFVNSDYISEIHKEYGRVNVSGTQRCSKVYNALLL